MMNRLRLSTIVAMFLVATFFTTSYALPLRTPSKFNMSTLGPQRWNVVLVEFEEDNTPVTTGNGSFLQTWEDSDYEYILDPPPHHKLYFQSHLKAISHYWRHVTHQALQIDTSASVILPGDAESVRLPHNIRYYHPADKPDSVDYRLAELVYEALRILKEDHGENSLTETLILFHAGVGQDFDFSDMYDPTPFDIPSFYFDESFLSEYLSSEAVALIQSLGVKQGIVLPEMQNQLELNVALNGTSLLMSGFLLGLPPLYNTETGRSGTGIFGFMDQGSNNANGLLPIGLSAFERIIMGIQSPQMADHASRYSLLPGDILKIPVSSREYFLVEYRKNAGIRLDSLYQNHLSDTLPDDERFESYLDALEKVRKMGLTDYTLNPSTGVLEAVENYDITLPASGLLIWHVYDPHKTLFEYPENPNGQTIPMVRLEEADGGYDIGKNYGPLSGSVNQGWKWDMWFPKNMGFLDNNSHIYNIKDIEFSDRTHPNTRSFSGIETGIRLKQFTFTPDSASFTLDFLKERPEHFAGFEALGTWDFHNTGKSIPYGLQDNHLVCLEDTGFVSLADLSPLTVNAENTAIFPYENKLILIHSQDDYCLIRQYQIQENPFKAISATSTSRSFALDIGSLVLYDKTLFLPHHDAVNPGFSLYQIDRDLVSGPFSTVSDSSRALVYDHSLLVSSGNFLHYPDEGRVEQLPFTIGKMVSYSDTLIVTDSDHGGFYYYDVTAGRLINTRAYQQDLIIDEVIPLDLPETRGPDFLLLGTHETGKSLVLTDSDGHPWNGFPVKSFYDALRVYFDRNDLRIMALKTDGQVDILDQSGTKLSSYTITPKPFSFFLSSYGSGLALFSEGDRLEIEGDSLHWAYPNGDLWGTRYLGIKTTATDYPGGILIAKDLIYNYPNPVSDEKTYFRYFAVEAEYVDIKIYDLRGKFVEQLQQTPIQQQWNEIPWDIRALDSGVYIAKITITGSGREKTFIIKPAILK